ncbi:MAG: nucleotide sugar dehydrogenase [Candidatus Omnitrophica bacterium]|nr:nucleotide sugar dehydrogenase [Candidatus Omnitrophota bacterium]MCM8802400.1 nucleotide sugar dehydrogenase [Candidatus Omnitrophota bacterium]
MGKIENLIRKIKKKEIKVGVIGLGYVGLPLVIRFVESGFKVIGFDIDLEKVEKLKKGISYINYIPCHKIKELLNNFEPTFDMRRLKEVDAILICVPTPLNPYREPDLTYLYKTANDIYENLRQGHIISLESTTYPGTTREIYLSKFEEKGLKVGEDFFLIYSPEREDPGNPKYKTKDIPKVVGGITENCRKIGAVLYSQIVDKVVLVSSTEVAEATKLLENIYRAVNIALVNELKMLFDRMGIDIWEVIEASKTKPFGFQAFYPGPGLGGHCIPIDPFYLTWVAKRYDFTTSFIELAGEINTRMPYYVVEKCIEGLNMQGKSIKGSKILIVGIAYKKDVDDIRESPAFKIIKILEKKNVDKIDYYDPYVKEVKKTRQYSKPISSIDFYPEKLKIYDLAIIVTDHSNIDYKTLYENLPLIIDTRNVYKKNLPKVIKA